MILKKSSIMQISPTNRILNLSSLRSSAKHLTLAQRRSSTGSRILRMLLLIAENVVFLYAKVLCLSLLALFHRSFKPSQFWSFDQRQFDPTSSFFFFLYNSTPRFGFRDPAPLALYLTPGIDLALAGNWPR